MARASAKSSIVDSAANLQRRVRAASCPSHLLRFAHPVIDGEIRRRPEECSPHAQPGAVTLGVVDEPVALTTEIAIQLRQGRPKLPRWSVRFLAVWLALKGVHDLADRDDADLGVLGLAVPQAPSQALNLSDDCLLCLLPRRGVGRQSVAICFRCCRRIAMWNQSRIGGAVTPAAANVDRRRRHPSLNPVSSVSPARPTASSRRSIKATILVSALRRPRKPGGLQTLTRHCRRGPRMPLVVLAAADEGRIHPDGDCRRRNCWLDYGAIMKLLTHFQSMGAQHLLVRPSIDEHHLFEHVRRDTIGRKSRTMGVEFIQL